MLITSLLHRCLTLAVVGDVEDGTLATDTPHGICVLDVAHEEFMIVEHPCGVVHYLTGTHKPGTFDPWVTTEKYTKQHH